MLPNEAFWRDVKKVPKLKATRNIHDYYAWYDGVEHAVNNGLAGGWGFATGSISYPSVAVSNRTGAGREIPIYPILKRVSDEGLDYIMMRLPKLRGQDNYTEWRGSLCVFMDAKGLYGYCDGSVPQPREEVEQLLDVTPTQSDTLEDGLKNWREDKLDNLLDDQKMWLLVDKLITCVLYITCCTVIQRSLSYGLDRNELKTSRDILQYINQNYSPPHSTLILASELQTLKRARYGTFQEFATAFRYVMRAFEDADQKLEMSYIITLLCCAFEDSDEEYLMKEAIIQFIDERKLAGQSVNELKLGDVIAIAERMDRVHRTLQPTSRRNRNTRRR
jgi:hypothetical protein